MLKSEKDMIRALSLKHQELIVNKSQFKTVISINLKLWLYRPDLIKLTRDNYYDAILTQHDSQILTQTQSLKFLIVIRLVKSDAFLFDLETAPIFQSH